MADMKKFLDQEGVKYLWSKINMQDYPNNEMLIAVINAIDETKADKEYVNAIFDTYILNIDYDNSLKFDLTQNTLSSLLGEGVLGTMVLGF